MLNQIGQALLTSAAILCDWKQVALAGFFGFISSSCSFAAIAALSSVLVKSLRSNSKFKKWSELSTGEKVS